MGENPAQKPIVDTFCEHAFVNRFEGLIDAGEAEEALDYFLGCVGALANSGIQRRAKLNHLRYASRILEAETSAKHGAEKLAKKVKAISNNLGNIHIPKGGTFLDFGCGEHDPLALATVFHLNGAKRAIACDMKPPNIPLYSATSMHEILLNLKSAPWKYQFGDTKRAAFLKRLAQINRKPFVGRDFEAGIAAFEGKIDYRIADLVSLDVEDDELSLAVSLAVLEHVSDPVSIYEWLHRKTRPNGVHFHFIDLADHRAYSRTGEFDRWSFLTTEDAPRNLNRLRAHEHIALIEQAGFRIISTNRITSPVPSETLSKIREPWRDLPKVELETTGLHIVLRKPA